MLQTFKRYETKRLYIGLSEEKGRGVYAAEPIFPYETICETPYIPLNPLETEFIRSSASLCGHYFVIGDNQIALPFGYATFLNCSLNPNCFWEADKKNNSIRIISQCNIETDQEILINYGLSKKEFKNKNWF